MPQRETSLVSKHKFSKEYQTNEGIGARGRGLEGVRKKVIKQR